MSDSVSDIETYDPTQNPRYLPAIAEALERESREVTSSVDIELSREELLYKNAALETTRTDGWSHIAWTAKQKLEAAQARGLRAQSLDELRRAQGEIDAYAWLLELPQALAREQHRLRSFLAENDQDEEGDG